MATADQRTALPTSVTVVFPRSDSGAPSGTPTAYEVSLASLGLATVPNPPATFTGTRVLWSSAVAYWEGGGSPTNNTELQALANQTASDWYAWQLAPYDLTLQGWVPWACDGAHDVIIDHTLDRQQTRVVRGCFLEHVEHRLNAGTYGSLPPTGGNNYYNTTVNYGGNTTVNYGPNTSNYFYGPVYYPPTTVTTWTTNQTNLTIAPGTSVRMRVATNAQYLELRSIAPGATPAGRILYLHNVGAFVILIVNEDGGSTAANRITTTTGNYYFLAPSHCVALVYDAVSSRWRVSENSDERLEGVYDLGTEGGDLDDLELPPEFAQFVLEPTANISITGVAYGRGGLRLRLHNSSDTYTITLTHQDGASQTPNRFSLPNGDPLEIPPQGAVEIDYDFTNLTWRALGICCGGGGTTYAQFAFKTISVAGEDDVVADTADDTVTFVAGTGIRIETDAATDEVTWSVESAGDPPAYVPRWVKRSFTYDDFATAATTNEIELWQIPPGGMVHAAVVKHSTAFAGGSIHAYSVSCGKPGGNPGDDTNLLTTFNVFQAVSGTTFAYSTGTDSDPPYPLFMQNFGTSYSLSIYAACSGGNLDTATQGAVDVWLLVSDVSDAPDEFGGGGGPYAHNAFSIVTSNSEAETASALDPLSKLAFEGTGPITVAVSQDGDGAVLTIGSTGATDAASVTYTPAVAGDWDGGTDPGNVDDALDQLAERVDSIEDLTYVENLNDLGDVVITAPSNGQVLKYNGTNWVNDTDATGGGSVDASAVTYTPLVNTDWDGDTDPGNVDDALDELAERVDDLENGGFLTTVDASIVTYSPATLGNWSSSTDPGDVDDALNQLALRTKTLEDVPYIGCTAYESGGDQLLTNLAYTSISFDTEEYDVGSIHAAGSTDFVAPRTGKYFVAGYFWANFYTGAGRTGSNIHTPINVGIYVNGTEKITTTVDAAKLIPVVGELQLNASDVVTLRVFHAYGADIYSFSYAGGNVASWQRFTISYRGN